MNSSFETRSQLVPADVPTWPLWSHWVEVRGDSPASSPAVGTDDALQIEAPLLVPHG